MGTLTKEDNMLRAMFSGRMVVLTDSEGITIIEVINFARELQKSCII